MILFSRHICPIRGITKIFCLDTEWSNYCIRMFKYETIKYTYTIRPDALPIAG